MTGRGAPAAFVLFTGAVKCFHARALNSRPCSQVGDSIRRALRRLGHAAVATALAGFAAAGAATHSVQLKSGAVITGTVLDERRDRVVIDLGYTVLTVPGDQVDRVTALGTPAAAAASIASTDLFNTAPDQPLLGINDYAAKSSPAVVLIRTPVAQGSGFFIHADGYIVTNNHVVAGEYRLTVTAYRRGSGELEKINYPNVRIVAQDPWRDLALLKVEAPAGTVFPTLPLGESGGLGEGETVFAIGSPLGLERTISQGIISQSRRLLAGLIYLQTTAQINPGNSGGPLFNLRGQVVGVNNMKAMMVGVEGVSFAIPVDTLKEFLRDRDAYAFDPRSPNAGYRYLSPAETSQPATTPLHP
jgi:serine protease Do